MIVLPANRFLQDDFLLHSTPETGYIIHYEMDVSFWFYMLQHDRSPYSGRASDSSAEKGRSCSSASPCALSIIVPARRRSAPHISSWRQITAISAGAPKSKTAATLRTMFKPLNRVALTRLNIKREALGLRHRCMCRWCGGGWGEGLQPAIKIIHIEITSFQNTPLYKINC